MRSPLIELRLGLGEGEQDGLAVEGKLRRDVSADARGPPLESPVAALRISQNVASGGAIGEGVFQHEQPAGAEDVKSVILLAHVVAELFLPRQARPLDEQDAVEIHQRIGKRDLPPQRKQLAHQLAPGGDVGGIDGIALGLQCLHLLETGIFGIGGISEWIGRTERQNEGCDSQDESEMFHGGDKTEGTGSWFLICGKSEGVRFKLL